MSKKTFSTVLLIGLLLFPFLSRSSTFRIYFENDFPFDDDSDYTNGARFEWQEGSYSFFLEQLMYSPENIKIPQYIPGTHPYAGFLGVGASKFFSKELNSRLHWNSYLELESGMVGPSSLAEGTQKTIHRLVGAHEPKGWDNQLHDEWEIQSVGTTGLEYLLLGNPDRWNLRIEDELVFYAGTIQDAVGNNLNIRLGFNSSFNRRPSEIEIRASEKRPTTFYLLVGNETRWWGWNVFLDGNRDGDSYSVVKEPWTTALKTGLGAEIGRLEIGWFTLFCTRQYETQRRTPNYMSFQLGYRF